MNALTRIGAILVLAALAGPPALTADVGPGDFRVLELAQSGGPTLSEAVERVRRQYDGRIVSAETRRQGNREMHYIRVMTEDGKVKTVTIPGRRFESRG